MQLVKLSQITGKELPIVNGEIQVDIYFEDLYEHKLISQEIYNQILNVINENEAPLI